MQVPSKTDDIMICHQNVEKENLVIDTVIERKRVGNVSALPSINSKLGILQGDRKSVSIHGMILHIYISKTNI